METQKILVTGGVGFIGTTFGREIEGCWRDCFGAARYAHTHEDVEFACCNMNYTEYYP